jgi:hypothetical protein
LGEWQAPAFGCILPAMSRHARHYSPDEIAALAERIRRLVEAEREIRITPATGWLVARAVRAFVARPTRETVMEVRDLTRR